MPNYDEKIKQLRNEIKDLEESINIAEMYPTETTQFYNALSRERAELYDKKRLLERLQGASYE